MNNKDQILHKADITWMPAFSGWFQAYFQPLSIATAGDGWVRGGGDILVFMQSWLTA